MTLEELQVVITGNMEPLMQQIAAFQGQIQPVADRVADVSQQATQAVQESAGRVREALQGTEQAQQAAADAAQHSVDQQRQSLDEIAEIAERAAQRYNESISGMGSTGAIQEPVPLTGAPATVTGSQRAEPEPEVPTGNTENDLTRLQARIQQVRQSIANMFGSAMQEAPAASEAVQQLSDKLDMINARADIQRRKLAELQAEYDRVVSSAGGADSGAALRLQERIVNTQARLQSLTAQSDQTAEAIRNLDAGLNETGTAGERAESGLKKAGSGASGLDKVLGKIQWQMFRTLFVSQILISGVMALATYMGSALMSNDAFANSLNNLKVQFLTAFNPIYKAVLPALTSLINALATAMSYVAAFISGLFGKTYAQSEANAASLNKNVKALQDTSKAAKAAKENMMGIDELNIIKPTDNDATKAATGKDAALVNTDFSKATKPKIDTSGIEAAGAKIKEIFKELESIIQPIYSNVIKPVMTNIGKVATEIWDDHLKPLWRQLQIFFKQLEDDAGPIWKVIGPATTRQIDIIVDVLGGAIDNVIDLVSAVIKVIGGIIDFLTGVFTGDWSKAWAGIQEIFSGVWDAITSIFKNALKALDEIFPGSVEAIEKAWSAVTGFFQSVWNGICKVFADVKNWFGKIFSDGWKAIQTAFKGVTKFFSKVWSEIIGAFTTGTNAIGSWFTNTFNAAWSDIKTAFDDVTNFFSGVWGKITGAFTAGKNGIGKWFTNTFGAAYSDLIEAFDTAKKDFEKVWSAITGAFSSAGVNAETWFKNTFDAAYSNITGAFDGMGKFFSDMWSGITGIIKTAINGCIDLINSFTKKLDWIPKQLSKVPGFTWAADFSIPEIPHLATGGLAYGPTYALVGDNQGAGSNPEVIAPLDKLKSMMGSDNGEVVETLNKRFDDLIDALGALNLSVNLDSKTIARASNKGNRSLGAPVLGGVFAP